MGWDGTTGITVEERIAELNRNDSRFIVVEHALRGTCLWQLLECRETGTRMIYLYLVKKVRGANEVVTKALSEAEYPHYFSCPLKFLKKAPVENTEWREAVQEFHKGKKKPTFTVGTVVRLNDFLSVNGKNVGGEEVKITGILPNKQAKYVVECSQGAIRLAPKHFTVA